MWRIAASVAVAVAGRPDSGAGFLSRIPAAVAGLGIFVAPGRRRLNRNRIVEDDVGQPVLALDDPVPEAGHRHLGTGLVDFSADILQTGSSDRRFVFFFDRSDETGKVCFRFVGRWR